MNLKSKNFASNEFIILAMRSKYSLVFGASNLNFSKFNIFLRLVRSFKLKKMNSPRQSEPKSEELKSYEVLKTSNYFSLISK
jgi:hypothetical protein